MIYIISDLHGCYDLYLKLLDEISFSQKDELYILGDVLDRGSNPIDLLLDIMSHSNITLLMGNHEQMFLDYIENPNFHPTQLDESNGSLITQFQYKMQDQSTQVAISKYLSNLPYIVELGDGILLTHAGFELGNPSIQADYSAIKELQTSDMVWVREKFLFSRGLKDKLVIVGHTPVQTLYKEQPTKVHFTNKEKNILLIDCGAVFEASDGKLACVIPEKKEVLYVSKEGCYREELEDLPDFK